MAGSKSNYLENRILDAVLGGGTFTGPATIYVALSTAAFSETATGASMSEVSTTSTGYARVAVTNNATNWPAASNGSKSNATAVTFPAGTGAWGTVLSFYFVDAASGGNVLYGGDLASSRTVGAGDTASFAAGALTVTED